MELSTLFREVCAGDESAVEFLTAMVGVLHLWDDLIDKDKPVTDDDINAAFWDALVVLPRNQFYQRHFSDLNPILVTAILSWKTANEFERNRESLDIAFVIRSAYVDLILMTALLCGGRARAERLGPAIRLFAHAEGFRQYQLNLEAEKAARGEE